MRVWSKIRVVCDIRQWRLHTRLGLVLTGLATSLLLTLAGLWLHSTRDAIHEEVVAATRVSEQWLHAIDSEWSVSQPDKRPESLFAIVRSVGRVRSNVLEIRADDGSRVYVSPPPTYKSGRLAPAWFSAMLSNELPERRHFVVGLQVVLYPDTSRAVLDAWDDLLAMLGWGGLLLGLLFVATRQALLRALRPLDQVMLALNRTGSGQFDIRLPVFPTPELGRLSCAFNGMADRLLVAVNDNIRLETERELAEKMQGRLEADRRAIARELHDEMAQGITAVRALAGAIVQRTGAYPMLHSNAQSIVAVTGEMQEGVRHILNRLRPATVLLSLAERLVGLCAAWQSQHPDIAMDTFFSLGEVVTDESVAQVVLRIVQEGLTNIIRHSGASRVDLTVRREGPAVEVSLSDNGRGLAGDLSWQDGSGLGLIGMRERVALLGGELRVDKRNDGGFRLLALLPEQKQARR